MEQQFLADQHPLNDRLPGLTLLLASWLSWQDLAKF